MGEYYGQINEYKAGLTDILPAKPEAMIYYEQIEALGVPLVEGGIMDQPWVFMQEYKIVDNMKTQMALIEKIQEASSQGDANGS